MILGVALRGGGRLKKVKMILADPKTGKAFARVSEDQIELARDWLLHLTQLGKPVARVLVEVNGHNGRRYEIIHGKDGITYCTCMGWKMKKTCKHLTALNEVKQLASVRKTVSTPAKRKVKKRPFKQAKPEFSLRELIDAEVRKLSGR